MPSDLAAEPSLEDRLLTDTQAAMRSGDDARRDTLRMLRAAVHNEEVARRAKLDDAAVVEVLQRELKKREEAMALFQQGKRDDLVAKSRTEIEIISHYLPAMLGPDEVEIAVREAVQEAGADDVKQMGQVMKVVMPRLKGRADGKLVSDTVRRVLTSKG
jgi:uncharacterized protein